jgi:ring-1,2-phenylacetyl-CoA epoxidase subunit PaaD
LSTDQLTEVVARVRDPEIDIGLGDLGVLALGEIARRVRAALADAAPGHGIEIVWDRGAWEPAAVSGAGRDALRRGGYGLAGTAPRCPYCGCDDVVRAGRFGGAVCKVPYDCRGCGSPFDVIGTAGCNAVLPLHGSAQGGPR